MSQQQVWPVEGFVVYSPAISFSEFMEGPSNNSSFAFYNADLQTVAVGVDILVINVGYFNELQEEGTRKVLAAIVNGTIIPTTSIRSEEHPQVVKFAESILNGNCDSSNSVDFLLF